MSGDQQLRAFIERILRLKEEQDTLAADIREVYAEAKGSGFDKTAMGQLVAHLRKVEKVGVAAVEEGQTVFDTYLDAYRRATGTGVATHTHEPSQSYAEVKGIDRGTRRKQRTSEAMDDAKALSAEAAALGLIDPEAHAETARIADAVARKYGAGVIDPETGEITEHEQPETATQSPAPTHKAAGHAPRNEGSEGANTEQDDVEGSAERAGHAGQPLDALAGQVETRNSDNFVERNTSGPDAKRAPHSNPQPTSSPDADKTGEVVPPPASPVAISDADVPEFIKRTRKPLRPHCLRPELCGSGTHDHCYTCKKAMAGSEAA